MKQRKLFKMKDLLTLIISLSSFGCEVSQTNAGELLAGQHYLGQLNEGESEDSYFLVNDNPNGIYTETKLSFSFQVSDGSYAMATLPLNKIRVKFYEEIETPYVTFRWTPSVSTDVQYIMDNFVTYMVVYCKEKDFPMDI